MDIDKLLKKYPLFMNAVLPTLVVAFAMLMMFTMMSLIQSIVV